MKAWYDVLQVLPAEKCLFVQTMLVNDTSTLAQIKDITIRTKPDKRQAYEVLFHNGKSVKFSTKWQGGQWVVKGNKADLMDDMHLAAKRLQ